MNTQSEHIEISDLLERFNKRDSIAFGKVYSLLFSDFHGYARMLYRSCDIEPNDIVQDVLLRLWNNKKQKFEALDNIKAYVITAIRNEFVKYLTRDKNKKDKLSHYLTDDMFVIHLAEDQIFSSLPDILNMLPEECAKVLKMSLEGWEIKDIADNLGKCESTVYNQRREALRILRQKIPKNKLLLIQLLFGI